jgi:hypothetical protein
MGEAVVTGDWAHVTLDCRVDSLGHWTVDVEVTDRYTEGRRRFPIASGAANVPVTLAVEDKIVEVVRSYAMWAVHHVTEPF